MKRFILYIDILGFKELLKNLTPESIYNIVDSSLQIRNNFDEIQNNFSVIYFSDTIIFYRNENGYNRKTFLDIITVAETIFVALLARRIPIRGVITYGEFNVNSDSSNKYEIFFGDALIEAYELERKENWIGVTVAKSAWEPYENENPNIDELEKEKVLLRRKSDDTLLLNPLRNVITYSTYPNKAEQLAKVRILKYELNSYRFIADKSYEYSKLGDFTSRIAQKYHSTVKFFDNMLGENVIEWILK